MLKTLKGLAIISFVIGIMVFGGLSKANEHKKESRFKNHDEVMEYLDKSYYQGKTNNYEIKSMWKGNKLQYVTEFHTGVMDDKVWYIVTIYDNDLNKRKVFAETDSEIVWEDTHDFVEGL